MAQRYRPTRFPADVERGVTLVEYCLAFPLLLVMLVGLFDFGIAFYHYNLLQHTVDRTTREVAARLAMNGSQFKHCELVRRTLTEEAREYLGVRLGQKFAENPVYNDLRHEPKEKRFALLARVRVVPQTLPSFGFPGSISEEVSTISLRAELRPYCFFCGLLPLPRDPILAVTSDAMVENSQFTCS